MEKRRLGTSQLEVSVVGLGGNNFGGRLDLAATRAVVHRALDLGVTLIDTADAYNSGALGGPARSGARGAAPARGARHQVRAGGRRFALARRRLARIRHASRRSEPAAAAHRLDRSLPAAPAGRGDADRGDAARARRPGAAGQGAPDRLLQPDRRAARRGAADRAASRLDAFHLRPGPVQSARARHRARAGPGNADTRDRAASRIFRWPAAC